MLNDFDIFLDTDNDNKVGILIFLEHVQLVKSRYTRKIRLVG